MEYKYMFVKSRQSISEAELNEYGKKGWELVSILPCDGGGTKSVMKISLDDYNMINKEEHGELLKKTIEDLYRDKYLSARACNCLRRMGVNSVSEMVVMSAKILNTKANSMWGFGVAMKEEINKFMRSNNLA